MILRLWWDSVDEVQWSRVRTTLNTEQLAPHGCLSWHSRWDGKNLRVTALWDGQYGAQIFARGRLGEAVDFAGLDHPEVALVPVPGVSSGRRRRPAA